MPAFNPISEPVNYIILAGSRSPGLCDVTEAASQRRWDERRGFGLSGATSVFRGVALAHPVVTFRLYSEQDWLEWALFALLLVKPPPMVRPRAMEIWHPILEDLDIKAVGVEKLDQPIQTGDGEWSIKCKFIEYRKLQPALSLPDGAATHVADPEIDARLAEIERLSGPSQIERRAAGDL